MHKTIIQINIYKPCCRILPILLFLSAQQAISQVSPDFNLVRGTNDFLLGKVNSIAQDRFGYMWFTGQTNNCLACYDGYLMKKFRNDRRDSHSLSSNAEALHLYLELRSLRFLKKNK